MNIVVIGGTGLIGSKLVAWLLERGHKAVAASPNSGVNAVTGQGLAGVLKGAAVIVDVSNSPSFEDAAVLEFFTKSTNNLLAEGSAAGVGHYIALSVVGTERLIESGYFRAKVAQEQLIKRGSIPYSIVHATQFFEFVKGIADSATHGNEVRLSTARIQPIAAIDVAHALGEITLAPAVHGTIEVAGPETFGLDELIRKSLAARKDPRTVIADANALYFGTKLQERSLLPGGAARIGRTRFEQWLGEPSVR